MYNWSFSRTIGMWHTFKAARIPISLLSRVLGSNNGEQTVLLDPTEPEVLCKRAGTAEQSCLLTTTTIKPNSTFTPMDVDKQNTGTQDVCASHPPKSTSGI